MKYMIQRAYVCDEAAAEIVYEADTSHPVDGYVEFDAFHRSWKGSLKDAQ